MNQSCTVIEKKVLKIIYALRVEGSSFMRIEFLLMSLHSLKYCRLHKSPSAGIGYMTVLHALINKTKYSWRQLKTLILLTNMDQK